MRKRAKRELKEGRISGADQVRSKFWLIFLLIYWTVTSFASSYCNFSNYLILFALVIYHILCDS